MTAPAARAWPGRRHRTGEPIRRALFILNLILLAASVVAWAGSYRYSFIATRNGYGFLIERGGYYLLPPPVAGPDSAVHFHRSGSGMWLLEVLAGSKVQRWKPVRIVDTGLWGKLAVVSAWVPPLLLAVPAVLMWRRRRRDEWRGFDVQQVRP